MTSTYILEYKCDLLACAIVEPGDRSPRLSRLDRLDILIPVQFVVVNVLNDAVWQQVFDAHPSPDKEADFGGRDVVIDELFDDNDVSSAGQFVFGESDRAGDWQE